MNMLQIIQAAAGELGITQPALAVGVKNDDTIQLLALLNGLGGDLQREYIWQALCKDTASPRSSWRPPARSLPAARSSPA
jgi:hypothetical protein